MMNDENVFWMVVYAAAIANGSTNLLALYRADEAITHFRNSEVLFPHQPPEAYPVDESEDAPF